ncbi:hypothetical protein [Paenibacillus thalictri]|nr:hypothetical protein [Paenibacillus thalictri]
MNTGESGCGVPAAVVRTNFFAAFPHMGTSVLYEAVVRFTMRKR